MSRCVSRLSPGKDIAFGSDRHHRYSQRTLHALHVEGMLRGKRMRLGRYELFARLGKGGMADVFLARAGGPLGFSKLVVIKKLRADEDAFLEMFLDEARLAARLRHPNIVDTYDVGEADGSYFMAM